MKILNREQLDNLLASKPTEKLRLEFKCGYYSNDHIDDMLKDVSSFANGYGGTIILGIEDGTLKCVGVDDSKFNDVKSRMLNQIGDSIQPAISDLTIEAIPHGDPGKIFVAINVGQSYVRPHRASRKGKHYFYTRYDGGSTPMNMHEIRRAFLEQESTLVQMKSLITERTDFRTTGIGYPKMNKGPEFVAHAIPHNSMFDGLSLDTGSYSSKLKDSPFFATNGSALQISFDGIQKNKLYQDCTSSHLQLLRTGVVEYCKSLSLNDGRLDPVNVEMKMTNFAVRSLMLYSKIGISRPVSISFQILGVKNVSLDIQPTPNNDYMKEIQPAASFPDLILPIVYLEQIPSSLTRDRPSFEWAREQLQPAILAFWNAYGKEQSMFGVPDDELYLDWG